MLKEPKRIIAEEPGEIHHLSGVWKSQFRFIGNRDSVKKEIILFQNPYNEDMHPMV